MALTLRQLRYFEALAQERNFARAAEKVHISQPALSMQLRELEAALGVQLVERLPREARLTPAGRDVLARGANILREVRKLEDLGRAARRVTFTAFLIEESLAYGGGGVIDQEAKLISACESLGEGELVHPTLGMMQVSCVEAAVVSRWDSGRVVEVSLAFVESGAQEFPDVLLDTLGDIMSAAGLADEAIGTDFFSKAAAAIKSGITSVQEAVKVAAKWASIAQGVIRNATNIYQTLRNLRGSFGRYKGLAGITMGIQATSNSIKRLLAIGTQARSAVNEAGVALSDAASRMGVD